MLAGEPPVTSCTHRATRAPGVAVPAQQGTGQVAAVGWQGVVTSHLTSSILPASLSRLKKGFEPGSVHLFVCLFGLCVLAGVWTWGRSEMRTCPGCKKHSDRARPKVHPS